MDGRSSKRVQTNVAAGFPVISDHRKITKAIASTDPDKALEEYRVAMDLVYDGSEDVELAALGPRAHETFDAAIKWLIDIGRYSTALAFFGRYKAVLEKNEMLPSLHKAFLMESVLVLGDSDNVKSQQVFMSHLQNSEYLRTQDCKAEEDLLTAIKNRNRDGLEEVSS
jgi:DNA-binding GntR family transcriptional regulator